MITDTLPQSRRLGPFFSVVAVVLGLSACSHIQHLWPWHHAPGAPAPAVSELVVVGAAGAVLPQTWDRNALRVDLTGIAGEGELRLAPARGHAWPLRLEFAVRPGSFKRLEVRGEQRVIMSVPDTGAVTVLPVPQGSYAPTTAELVVHYGP